MLSVPWLKFFPIAILGIFIPTDANADAAMNIKYGRSLFQGKFIYLSADRFFGGNKDCNFELTEGMSVIDARKGDIIPLDGEFYRVENVDDGRCEVEPRKVDDSSGVLSESHIRLVKLSVDYPFKVMGKETAWLAPDNGAYIGVGNQPITESYITCSVVKVDVSAGSTVLYWEVKPYPWASPENKGLASIKNLHGIVPARVGETIAIPYMGNFVLQGIVVLAQTSEPWVALTRP